MRKLEVVAEAAFGRVGVHGMSVVRISAAPARNAEAAPGDAKAPSASVCVTRKSLIAKNNDAMTQMTQKFGLDRLRASLSSILPDDGTCVGRGDRAAYGGANSDARA